MLLTGVSVEKSRGSRQRFLSLLASWLISLL
jgi:hypothetical protein